ncbi:MAG: RNA 2',3'-cyclic phosphodiesterase [Parcubacteria group bacterium]|jgi:2'-5' RNA ligase
MKRKIFISINIPDKVKKRLVKAVEKWADSPPHQEFRSDGDITQKNTNSWCGGLPVKWTKEANLHITLLFLGYVDEETLLEVCQKVREVVGSEDIFDIEFDRIELFPSATDPKMVALTGPTNADLLRLNEKIEKELNIFTSAKKTFRPHITLGRGRKYKWEALKSKPSIEEKYPLVITAETIDVMASDFGDGNSEYTIIESCPLR